MCGCVSTAICCAKQFPCLGWGARPLPGGPAASPHVLPDKCPAVQPHTCPAQRVQLAAACVHRRSGCGDHWRERWRSPAQDGSAY